MKNIIQDVVIPEKTGDQSASTGEKKTPEVKNEGENTSSPAASTEETNQRIEELVKIAEEALAGTTRAEGAVVKYKKLLKDSGIDDGESGANEEVNARLERIEQSLSQLATDKQVKDSETSTLRKRLSETTEALKSKNSISNSGSGANQSKLGREQQLPALTQSEKLLAQRMAQRNKTSVQEAEKKLAESKLKSPEELGIAPNTGI